MKYKVTIPVLLTIEVSEPDPGAAEELLRDLLGEGCTGSIHPVCPQVEEMFATLPCEISLPPAAENPAES